MDCLGSTQIAGVCGILERFQYFHFRRVSGRCVDKSHITAGPSIAMPPSCFADGHWWFQFLLRVTSTLRRVLRTDFSAAALAVVFGADRFGANIITLCLALLWFPNLNSPVGSSVPRIFPSVPTSFFLHLFLSLHLIVFHEIKFAHWNLTQLLVLYVTTWTSFLWMSLIWSMNWQHSTLCYCLEPDVEGCRWRFSSSEFNI